jgi:tRNA1(Val) A37 N6-methylase TrmN6
VQDATDKTIDAFHRGRFHVVQPAKGAHRAGMDALVLAAAVPSDFSGVAMDFGAGAGAASLTVLSRCPAARAVLVEKSPEMAGFAAQTLALAENAQIAYRATLICADVTLTGKARHTAGLADRSADFVMMNPPFNDNRDRATPNDLRRQAHVADGALFESWLRSAAAVLKPRGGLALIARPASLDEILAAAKGRFGGIEVLPIHPTIDRSAIRIVVRAVRGSRAGLSILPPLILHEGAGNRPTARADAVINGQALLFAD